MVAIPTAHDTTRVTQNTPQCLRVRRQWVVWRREERDGKMTKVPYSAKTGRRASSTDPATWVGFEEAVALYARDDRYDGVGYVFSPDDAFTGIDLDDCLDAEGRLADWAEKIVAIFRSYTEISPSGRGLKIFIRGTKPDFAQCSFKNINPGGEGELELYDRSRYFCVTGDLWPGSTSEVADRQEELDEFCRMLWQRPVAERSMPEPAPQPETQEEAAPAGGRPPGDTRIVDCLAAMLKLSVKDKSDGSHRLYTACCRCVEFDLTDREALHCVRAYESQRPFPIKYAWQDIQQRLRDAEKRCERGSSLKAPTNLILPDFRSVGQLLTDFPHLRLPVVHNLLRQGEVLNLVSSPKCGKSWLATDLALAIATGRAWLEMFPTEQGQTLILDNELHSETISNRIPKVAAARGIDLAEVADTVFVEPLRGRLHDIFELASYFEALEPGRFKVIVLDAFYRFMPKDCDENDNATIASVYNQLDKYADRLGCCFVLIHHSSKGNQSGKSVTDVGAGAGSQSRATDTHMILRPHEQDGAVVLDAAVRSWPPLDAFCLKWDFPVWQPALDLDPTALRPERQRRRKEPKEQAAATVREEWDAEKFTEAFIVAEARTRAAILEAAEKKGLSQRRAETLLRRAVETGQAHPWKFASNQPVKYATESQPLIDAGMTVRKHK